MKIACPKERKVGEKRVALTPDSIKILVDNEIEVLIEKDAGLGCGYTNEDYIKAGAKIGNQKEVWEYPFIIKVKEPQEEEFELFKENQVIFGFLHLAASPKCVEKLKEKKVTAIAAETIKKDGIFNLLKPVSQIAGRRSILVGAHYLETFYEGKGILLTGTDYCNAANVLIVGGGEVGINACDVALGLNCSVTIAELSEERIEFLKNRYKGKKVNLIKSTEENIADVISDFDLIISTVLIPGGKAPKVITKKITDNITSGSVVVDVSADQGGTIEIMDKVTSHLEPIKIIDGVLYYAVPNMPGAVPKTASESIQGSIEYIIKIKELTVDGLAAEDLGFKNGIQVLKGNIVNENLNKSL